jgi:dTDP-4-dehydrorhamnose reductase
MKILLFARNGQLGWELQRTLAPLGDVLALDFPQMDFTKPISLRQVVREAKADLIVNPAAYTAVDNAESEPEKAYLVNCAAVEVLASESKTLGIPLVHYSTDFVFDGTKGTPYIEQDQPNPLSVYGKTKLAGDQAVLASGVPCIIMRTSWVYSMRQGGFVTKVLTWARQQEALRIVDDQVSGPTSARMLAEATALMIAQGGMELLGFFRQHGGLYNLAGSGECSRYEWAKEIIDLDANKEQQKVREIFRATSEEFPSPATRPVYSALDCGKFNQTFGLRLPDWQLALKLMMESN